jgi:PAS domain S-box-containing protein
MMMSTAERAPARKNTEELLSLMVAAVEDYAIYMVDTDGTILTWNSGAERNSGYTASEIIGRNYSSFFPREEIHSGIPEKELADARVTGRVRREGWRMRKDGTKFWAVQTLTAVRDKSGELIGFAKVTRDLSDRREQEVALRHAMEEAKVANATKSEFLANMSHELRTPLNAILGFSEMMITEVSGPLGNKNREYAGHVHSSGHHLLALINDLLDFSKLDANAMVLDQGIEDLHRIARCAVDTIQPLAAKAGVHVLLEVSGEVSLHCDDRRMLQILLNLLSNSVKFTGDGGRVTLRVHDQGDAVCVSVEDTGIGMKPEEIPQALSRFGQIESVMARTTQGTGLGLPLVKQLVELHGGTLVMISEKGIGTRVTLLFPKSSAQSDEQG